MWALHAGTRTVELVAPGVVVSGAVGGAEVAAPGVVGGAVAKHPRQVVNVAQEA